MSDEHRQQAQSFVWWVRASWILTGALWFFWIGIEDPSTATVLLMSAMTLLALAVTAFQRSRNTLPASSLVRALTTLFIGLAGGLLITPTAAVLMAIKNSLHSHVVPEFVHADLINVLASTPVWTLGGLMLAGAAALYDNTRSQPPAQR